MRPEVAAILCRPNQQGFESGSQYGAMSAQSEADVDLEAEAGSAMPAGLIHDREMQHQVGTVAM